MFLSLDYGDVTMEGIGTRDIHSATISVTVAVLASMNEVFSPITEIIHGYLCESPYQLQLLFHP